MVFWLVPAILVGLYLGVAAFLYARQRSFLYHPNTARPDSTVVGLDALQEVHLPTSDGLALLAWYVPPTSNGPVLAYFHGNAGNLGSRSYRLKHYVAAGWGVLMVEYRGYGGNPGRPTESGFAADARAAMTFLDDCGVASERVALYGESIGTGVATRVASERPVAALVLESPYTSITDIARRRFFFLPVDWLLRDRFDSLSCIGRVQAPLLVLQGGLDTIVAPALGRELFQAASEPKELWVAPEAGHNDLMEHGAAEAVVAFVTKWVPWPHELPSRS
jgi:uncharacterized protein